MFPPAGETLKKREGAVAETPLANLLSAISAERRSCTLELKVRALEKRLTFEEGSPVACVSNLLHETLGKFLVEKGKITEAQYQEALSETIQGTAPISELLVKKGLIPPFELYKQMQTNLALKVLDCFRWVDAQYRFVNEAEAPDLPLRVNTAQLVLTGVATFLPFDVVATQLAFMDEQRFALVPGREDTLGELKLSAKETKLLQVLRGRPIFGEVVQRTGFDTEESLRRLYALAVLGLMDFAEAVPEAPAQAPRGAPAASSSPPAAPAAAPAAPPAPDAPAVTAAPVPAAAPEDDALRDALAAAYLDHRGKDPFDLLKVAVDVQPVALRKAFLAMADQFSPLRFQSRDLREKAEALLLTAARAYGALSDPDQLAIWKKRREAASGKRQAAPPAQPQFKISTQLLDATTQFAEGKKRLDAKNPRGALEYFQYACDIEPRARHHAYLAWTRYLINPVAHARLALQELADAVRREAGCEEAHFFTAEIQRTQGQLEAAEAAYRLAFKANPQNRKYADLAHETARQKKSAQK